ncbi:MAG: hypothetical protein HKO11_07935, partial [Eudoraea sp.]|nr:hypothetical protein [Eudoraea sp.]
MKIKWSLILVVLLLWIGTTGYSQEPDNTLPLQQVLEDITRSHGYRFNYPTEIIREIQVIPPDIQWPIDKILAYLSDQTGLLYSELPNKFISIQKPVKAICGYIKDRNTGNILASATVQ